MVVHFVPDGKASGWTGGETKGGHKEKTGQDKTTKKEIVPTGADGEMSKK